MQMREWKPSLNSVLCSKHFRREDIEVRLRPNAVPMFFDQFPPKIIEVPVGIRKSSIGYDSEMKNSIQANINMALFQLSLISYFAYAGQNTRLNFETYQLTNEAILYNIFLILRMMMMWKN